MNSLVIASTNPGKVREIGIVLAGIAPRLLTLADLPATPEPKETGATFAENAALKARAYARASGLPTVAEDSGLAIDALDGRPGVLSARYPGRAYTDKFDNLYRELAPHARPWRARFVCSLAFVDPDLPHGEEHGMTFACEATIEGEITSSPRGTHGFGYDPIFYYAPYGCTLGEVTGEQKLAVAHRGKAFRLFREWLQANDRHRADADTAGR